MICLLSASRKLGFTIFYLFFKAQCHNVSEMILTSELSSLHMIEKLNNGIPFEVTGSDFFTSGYKRMRNYLTVAQWLNSYLKFCIFIALHIVFRGIIHKCGTRRMQWFGRFGQQRTNSEDGGLKLTHTRIVINWMRWLMENWSITERFPGKAKQHEINCKVSINCVEGGGRG